MDERLIAVGTVFSLNDKFLQGQVRLFDNRRVKFQYDVVDATLGLLALKDQVTVEAILTEDGLVACRVAKVAENEGASNLSTVDFGAEPDLFGFVAQDQDSEAVVPEKEVEPCSDNTAPVKTSLPRSEARRLYEQAAVARAEERFSEARTLFENAIRSGGGPSVHSAYAKMLIEGKGRDHRRAGQILADAITAFPSHATFYVMYGQMERRAGNLTKAEEILREGLRHQPRHALLRTSLAQVLAQIATSHSLKEAEQIFDALEAEGKLNKRDNSYTRFRALASNPRAGRAYSFFDHIVGFRVGIPGKKELPTGVSDLVLEITDLELDSSFGISGAYIVRCFSGDPKRSDILNLSRYLRSLRSDSTAGLINGRELVINPAIAFVAIPRSATVRDYLMSVLSENNEAILPIDDQFLSATSSNPKEQIRDLLSQYLGSRDLYDSTLPVSGRRLFGREKLLVQLANQIQRGDFIGIFGLRKMGKTSLVYQLRDEKLRGEAVAYVDLQSSPGLTLGSFDPVYWEIEQDLAHRLANKHHLIRSFLRLARYERYSDVVAAGLSPALTFGEDIRSLLDLINKGSLPGVSKLIIVLDELERCLPLAGQQPMVGYIQFFGMLRGLAQTERYRGALASVVVAANAAISERAYWEGQENPVFSLYKPIFLPPLSKLDTAQMVQNLGKGMSVYWENAALDAIYVECGGHPFLTRVLCSEISQRHIQRPLQVTKKMLLDEIPAFVRDKSDKFQQIVELLRAHFPEEHVFLESLAVGNKSPPASDQSIRHLLGYQLIVESPSGFSISLNALRSWLRRQGGLTDE
ncbi:MAG: AAA-like domain-containing protein [Gallionellaceae bacterium]|nr:AAA-like domain-containing protein [Gallionellaceae bacterium]